MNFVLRSEQKGGLLQPTKEVTDIIISKHPPNKFPSNLALGNYPVTPPMVDLYIGGELVLHVAKKLHGGGGPGSTDATSLQHWLLRYGTHSAKLREVIGKFT